MTDIRKIQKIMTYVMAGIACVLICVIIAFLSINRKNRKLYTDADTQVERSKEMREDVASARNPSAYEYAGTVSADDMEEGQPAYDEEDIKNISKETEEMAKNVTKTASENSVAKGAKQTVSDNNLYKRVDFEKLGENGWQVNDSNIYGWLYIPDTNVDYIVMKGDKNDPYKYLWKDPNGNKSSTGSLFVRYSAPGEARDNHTIIYGHRLKNHNLYFGALLNFNDASYAQKHNKAYVYTDDKAYVYELCSVHNGQETDPVYLYPYQTGTAAYDWMIDELKTTESIHLKNFSKNKEMLVLSTCSGDRGGQPYRLYLVYEKAGQTKF